MRWVADSPARCVDRREDANGARTFSVRIPVTLSPGADDPIAASLEGEWTDPNGNPVPDGVPDDEPLVLHTFEGAEHCGWTSMTFLHMSWPVGTDDRPFRQYARDPMDRLRRSRSNLRLRSRPTRWRPDTTEAPGTCGWPTAMPMDLTWSVAIRRAEERSSGGRARRRSSATERSRLNGPSPRGRAGHRPRRSFGRACPAP